jgi:Uncharacterised MFS-type transporter YbfB
MQRTSAAAHSGGSVSAWRATVAGLCASLVGIGLARFAYTPLIPALIASAWFAPVAAACLGGQIVRSWAGGLPRARFGTACGAIVSWARDAGEAGSDRRQSGLGPRSLSR